MSFHYPLPGYNHPYEDCRKEGWNLSRYWKVEGVRCQQVGKECGPARATVLVLVLYNVHHLHSSPQCLGSSRGLVFVFYSKYLHRSDAKATSHCWVMGKIKSQILPSAPLRKLRQLPGVLKTSEKLEICAFGQLTCYVCKPQNVCFPFFIHSYVCILSIEYLLCASFCTRCLGYISEQNKCPCPHGGNMSLGNRTINNSIVYTLIM